MEYTPYLDLPFSILDFMKFTMVHPSFSKKWQKIAKKSKQHLQSALGIHDFFAFFCISQISQKKIKLPYKTRVEKRKSTETTFLIFFSGKNFTYLIFSPDLSLWFHKTSKKLGLLISFFFFLLISFFFFLNFQFCMENPPKKKMISLF